MNQWRSYILVSLILSCAVTCAAAQARRQDEPDDPLPFGARSRLGTVRLRHILRDGNDSAANLAFSPDGKTLVSTGDIGVFAWDVATGRKLPWLQEAGGFAVRFRPDGKSLILVGKRNEIKELETGTGNALQTFAQAPDRRSPDEATLSLDGKVAMLLERHGSPPSLSVTDSATGQLIHRHMHPGGSYFWRAALSPGGKYYAVASGAKGSIYNVATKQKEVDFTHAFQAEESTRKSDKPFAESFFRIAFSPDERILAGAGPGFLYLYDVRTGKMLRMIEGGGGRVAFSPDGKLLACGPILPRRPFGGNALRLFDVDSGKLLREFEPHAGHVHALAFAPDGKTIACGENHTITLWDVASGKRLHPVVGHQTEITCLAVTPDSRVLASGGDRVDPCVILWDLVRGKMLHRLPLHDDDVSCLAFSPDGKLLASGDGYYSTDRTLHKIRLWDVPRGVLVRSIDAHPSKISGLIFSKDGRFLASHGGEQPDRFWEVATGKEAATFPETVRFPPDRVPGALPSAAMPGGTLTAKVMRRDGSIDLIDPATSKLLESLGAVNGHNGGVSALQFTPDGKRLISGGRDTTILVWNIGD